jgi:hypothetical protein
MVLRIGYFLEDRGHEQFIVNLTKRITFEINPSISIDHDVKSSTGGAGRATTEFKQYLASFARGNAEMCDILIVAIDGNCKGYTEKRNALLKIKDSTQYRGEVIFAIPDPHIEYWYMADPGCFPRATDIDITPTPPAYKCERYRYKNALREAFRQGGVSSDGIEFGKDFAEKMDFFPAGKTCDSLRLFVEGLRSALQLRLMP